MAVYYLDTSAILKRTVPKRARTSSMLSTNRSSLLRSRRRSPRLDGRAPRVDVGSPEVAHVPLLVPRSLMEMTRRTRLRPGDSVHLASVLALQAKNEAEELVIVASDKELLAAVQGAGIKTLAPEAEDAMEVLKKMK